MRCQSREVQRPPLRSGAPALKMIDYATPVLGRDGATLERGVERGFNQTIEQRTANGGCLRRADLRRPHQPPEGSSVGKPRRFHDLRHSDGHLAPLSHETLILAKSSDSVEVLRTLYILLTEKDQAVLNFEHKVGIAAWSIFGMLLLFGSVTWLALQLAAGFWLPAAGYWLLVTGYWSPTAARHQSRGAGARVDDRTERCRVFTPGDPETR